MDNAPLKLSLICSRSRFVCLNSSSVSSSLDVASCCESLLSSLSLDADVSCESLLSLLSSDPDEPEGLIPLLLFLSPSSFYADLSLLTEGSRAGVLGVDVLSCAGRRGGSSVEVNVLCNHGTLAFINGN
jgi:hypothetical protein